MSELSDLDRLALDAERELAISALHHRIGYGGGWLAGYRAGRDAERQAWNEIIGLYAHVVSYPISPTRTERRIEAQWRRPRDHRGGPVRPW